MLGLFRLAKSPVPIGLNNFDNVGGNVTRIHMMQKSLLKFKKLTNK